MSRLATVPGAPCAAPAQRSPSSAEAAQLCRLRVSLKAAALGADLLGMAREPSCPICDSDLALAGDEQPGDEVYCSYCKSPVVIRARGGDGEADASGWEVEADF